jgi:CMP-N,N'-diacetyllegionaminic acid synthase
MYKGKKTLGIITARGGSKGIPRKNIKELAGKPLISYTIEAAKQSNHLTRCVLSTEDEKIAAVARAEGCDVPFMRPRDFAVDTATSMSVVQHALDWLKERDGEEYDYIMILQPTSPLRSAEDIDACIEKMIETDADSVMSVMELHNFGPRKIHKIKDGTITHYFEGYEIGRESERHQDLEPAFKRNGAVFLTKAELIRQGDFFGKASQPYVMPHERSVDIDFPIDFELAEFWLHRSREKGGEKP